MSLSCISQRLIKRVSVIGTRSPRSLQACIAGRGLKGHGLSPFSSWFPHKSVYLRCPCFGDVRGICESYLTRLLYVNQGRPTVTGCEGWWDLVVRHVADHKLGSQIEGNPWLPLGS